MKKSEYILSFCCLFLSACTSTMGISWVEPSYTGRAYEKIAVIGISNDLEGRTAFEGQAVALLKANGINAVHGINIFPPSLKLEKDDHATIVKILKENNLDGVITMSLLNTKDTQKYVQGPSYSIPSGYRRVGRYYYRTYTYVNTPGYYKDQSSYLIEATLYDVKGELQEEQNTMVWSGQSTLIDPSSAQDAAVRFTDGMVSTLINDAIILPSMQIKK